MAVKSTYKSTGFLKRDGRSCNITPIDFFRGKRKAKSTTKRINPWKTK